MTKLQGGPKNKPIPNIQTDRITNSQKDYIFPSNSSIKEAIMTWN